MILLGLSAAAVNLFFILNPKLYDGTENASYVILLGGGITKDAKLAKSVENRVRAAAEYLKAHPSAIVVVTGGKGSFAPCAEAEVLKLALAAFGIDESRILEEDKAKDTFENFLFSAEVLSEHGQISKKAVLDSSVAVVTSRFHLARAEKIAERIGFSNVYGVAADIPPLFVLNSYCREICAFAKFFIFSSHREKLRIID